MNKTYPTDLYTKLDSVQTKGYFGIIFSSLLTRRTWIILTCGIADIYTKFDEAYRKANLVCSKAELLARNNRPNKHGSQKGPRGWVV